MILNKAFQQEASKTIGDRETLKVILHPLRTRLITALSREARTVRELSAIVGVEPTKLYYHIKLLQKAGIIAAVEERQMGNLTETSYLCTAKDIFVDPELSQDLGEGGAFEGTISSFISALRSSLIASYRMLQELKKSRDKSTPAKEAKKPQSRTICLGIQALRLDEKEAGDFQKRLGELIKEFDGKARTGSQARQYEVGFAFYPSASPREEPWDEDKNES
jgi:DNA-binding transcriptional ArsR family regulator